MYRVVLSVLVVCLALTACGGKATPDPAEVARLVDEAVKATDAAMPTPEPQTIEVEKIVKETVTVEKPVEVTVVKEIVVTPTREPFEPEMILIPAGEFLMGSDPQKDKDALAFEQPQHTLYLPDYYMAKTPVTNAQYAAFVQATGHRVPNVDEDMAKPYNWNGPTPPLGKENHPVVLVSWYDAVAYCSWLAEVTGRPYRLPSEAEWEKAARGTDGRIYPWGDEWDVKRCNSSEERLGGTTPAGAYPRGASPYGLQDMVGNVWEWTRSLRGERLSFEYPYDPQDGREKLEAGDDAQRVLRGGSWGSFRFLARCGSRLYDLPGSRYVIVGFRVVVSPISTLQVELPTDSEPSEPLQTEKADAATYGAIRLLDWTWYESSSGNYIHVDGEIQNTSSHTIRYVQVHVKLLDSNGRLLGVDSSYSKPSDLRPGDKALFSIMARKHPGLSRVQVSQVTWEE